MRLNEPHSRGNGGKMIETSLQRIIEDPKWADTEIKMLRFKVANLKEDARIFENLKKDARIVADHCNYVRCKKREDYPEGSALCDAIDRILAATEEKK
jgi:hypothetical protein